MKNILMIATGGTLACQNTNKGLAPSLTGKQLIEFLPELKEICKVFVENPLNIDSTDITTEQRRQIAILIWQNYDKYDGFVISHGTDTLSYTAALLHHMLKNINKPIIITGAQNPINAENSDAPKNIIDSFKVACSNFSGVAAVLHGTIIKGNNVFKSHTTKLNPFKSINAPAIGKIDENGKVLIKPTNPINTKPKFVDIVPASFIVFQIIPDLKPDIFDFLSKYDKIILRGYGSGGIPINLEQVIKKLISKNKKVYITTQCTEGEVDIHKYEVGRRFENLGAISLENRSIEDTIAAIQCGEL